MGYAHALSVSSNQIPVIDIGPLRDNGDPLRVAKAIHEASCSYGFLYVSNHGIPDRMISTARAAGLDFFHLSEEEKLKVQINSSHRGYLKVGDAKMDTGQKPDLKESFVWGHELPAGSTGDHPLRSANQWPEGLPGLRAAVYPYFNAAHDVARDLLRAFALGLALPEDSFLTGVSKPMSRASITYYPPQPSSMGQDQFGVAPHTDFGVLTVLCQDDVGGLQVETLDGEWINAPPIPGTLVVNVGDLLARWTNDLYRSTPHRVINSSGRERLSLVVAYDPDHDTMIDPNIVGGQSNRSSYEPISCGDYLMWRMKKSFSYKQ